MVIEESSVTTTTLPNGLTVIVQTDRSAPVVAIVTHVKAGYFDESDEVSGVAHVLEHMYFKGTATRGVGEIAKQTKAAGGHLNAHTIYDSTVYYTVLPSSALEEGLRIQSDAYANSSIEPGELEKELEVIIEEAKRKADSPSAVATEKLFELLHDKHRIRRWRIGTETGLRALTRERLLSFYRGYYRPANTVLAISGDVDAGAALSLAKALYGHLQPGEAERDRGPAEPERTGFRYRELSGDVGQSQLLLGWRTPAALHPDTAKLDFAASLIGDGRASRLYRAVRERRLAAHVSAGNHTPTELGVFVIHAEADPETTSQALAAIWTEVRALSDGSVSGGEMDRVRSMFEAHSARRLEAAEGRAGYLAEWEALGSWRLGDDYRRSFLSTTASDVAAMANRYLTLDHAAVLVYRPERTPVVANDGTGMQAILESRSVGPVGSGPAAVRAKRAPRPGSVEFEREDSGVSVFRTRRGVPVLVRRKPGSPIAHVALHSRGGAVYDTAPRAGLTLLASRTMLKGTKSLSAEQIAQAAESLGATFGANAGAESFGWSLSVPTAGFEAAIDLFGDVVTNPAFTEDALETERRAALSNLALIRDDMMRQPVRLLTSAAFESHPYGVPVSGTEESLPAITPGELSQWHAHNVLVSPMVIGIVADLEPAEAARIAAAGFHAPEAGECRDIPSPVWTRKPRSVSESRDKAQTAIALAFPGPSRGDDARWAAHLLGTIASGLGGRFFEELRDKRSLAYTVHLSARDMRLGGMFIAYIATSPEKEARAREALLSEFERLRAEPVAPGELARARDYVIGSHAISKESGASLLGDMLDAWIFGKGLCELEDYDSQVRAVTAAAIQRVAQRSFRVETLVEATVRGASRTV